MPENIRTTNEQRSRPRRDGFLVSSLIAPIFLLVAGVRAGAATAALENHFTAFGGGLTRQEIAGLTLTLGLLCFAVLTAIMLVRTRTRAAQAETAARDETVALTAEIDRLRTLLLSQPQVVLAWTAAGDTPDIIGDAGQIAPGVTPQDILSFGQWLTARSAQDIGQAVEQLRSQGSGFALTLTAMPDRPVAAEGRIIGGRAVLRLRDVGGIERELADLTLQHENLLSTAETLRGLVDSLPTPIWLRDETGLLTFVNAAYVRAVEAKDASEAVENGIEIFDRAARTELARARAGGHAYTGRLPAILAGNRRTLDVVDTPTRHGSAGIAVEATENENLRAELARMIEAHRRILDQLATGVAIFGPDQKLIFHNAAFRALWELDTAFLEQTPSDSAVLEQLRAARKLPEEHDFRQWKTALHAAYRAIEPMEQTWHLPDGRTLRVVTMPNQEGGVTYLYHDVTERLDMARRYDALIKVQSETLDHLSEAVAVFASDGRIRLHNPAFARMWKLTPEALALRPHVEAVAAWCQALHDDNLVWRQLRVAVTSMDHREPTTARIERRDGMMIDCATIPLPDGATLVTFQDRTDSFNVERALRERNEALETADEIKVDFVHHVSYELRSPLTNIIGFAHFLSDPSFGPLNAKQVEYLGYITVSTNALLAIINNILDLATIDAGAMSLNLGEVDIRATMEAAAEGIQDRLVKDRIRLDIVTPPGIGGFTADERRLRQILFNLLANAAGFSPPNETITLSAERRPDAVVFTVTDRGPGIPPEAQEKVFDWFETHSRGSQHRGAGLGLSLVRSFVELHRGSVTLNSIIGEGTTVTCVFPLEQSAERSAA